MTAPSLDAGLVSAVMPSGRIDLRPGAPEEAQHLPLAAARRILQAFDAGRGPGVLHLGAAEIGIDLDPSLAYWRDFGQVFVAKVCAALDPTEPRSLVVPPLSGEESASFAQSVPPMPGAELVTPSFLKGLWSDIEHALAAEAARDDDGVKGYLRKKSSVWNVVGRVCLHLAENKRDPEHPFAFLATYVHKVSREARPQHLPLGRALKEYVGARNREKLLALLSPLSRAAGESALLRELVESGDVYHPLSWSPAEAHRFLREVPLYEKAGLVVRLPDWWSASKRPRPRVTVSVGGEAPSKLGIDALLDFDVKLTLDGEKLSKKEIETLLASAEGLLLIRGKWVEVDRDKLNEVLDQWRDVQKQARAGGVSFGEAMRMLAGARLDGGGGDESADARPDWSEVVAGKWLSSRLDALRSPALRSEIDAGAGLRTELRPYQKLGVQWLSTLRGLELGGCLADDMGLGKTIQVLGLLTMSRRDRTKDREGADLLVVPASLADPGREPEDRRHFLGRGLVQ
ncbi:MAG: SNF2 helicase-associated domain-containing protein, partial [Vicinamibacteria bacterium]